MKDPSIFDEFTKFENDNKDIAILEDGTCIQVSLTTSDIEMISVLFGPSEDRKLCYISLTDPKYLVGDNLAEYKNEVINSIISNWGKISSILSDEYKNPLYQKDNFILGEIPNYREYL